MRFSYHYSARNDLSPLSRKIVTHYLRETIFFVSLQQNNDIIMAQEIIGREPEIKEIEALYQTNKPVLQ